MPRSAIENGAESKSIKLFMGQRIGISSLALAYANTFDFDEKIDSMTNNFNNTQYIPRGRTVFDNLMITLIMEYVYIICPLDAYFWLLFHLDLIGCASGLNCLRVNGNGFQHTH